MLGGDTSLGIDQVGALTKPMVVNSLNFGLAKKLICEKKVNYVSVDKEKEADRKIDFMQYLVDLDDLSRFNEIVSKLGYTGKTFFSFLLPR